MAAICCMCFACNNVENVDLSGDTQQEAGGTDNDVNYPESSIESGFMQNDDLKMTINGNLTFDVTLYDNAATKSLRALLPVTLVMSDMPHEKYCYPGFSLPADAKKVSRIEAGDLMLWGDDCIVIFYESFSTSYSYTPLGKVNDVSGLKEALTGGNTRIELSVG